MIDNIKNAIYQNLNELFASATLDEMTGDFPAFKQKLKTIAKIAETLGVDMEIISVAINIKTGETIVDVVIPDEASEEPVTDMTLLWQ